MVLHISFADGSNPFVKYGTRAELEREIHRWKRRFIILDRRDKGGCVWLNLSSKRTIPDLFDSLPCKKEGEYDRSIS